MLSILFRSETQSWVALPVHVFRRPARKGPLAIDLSFTHIKNPDIPSYGQGRSDMRRVVVHREVDRGRRVRRLELRLLIRVRLERL